MSSIGFDAGVWATRSNLFVYIEHFRLGFSNVNFDLKYVLHYAFARYRL